ncbi:hypothetical protein P7K49_026696 [Saguinus oedipus]|uniref:Uncharacterized protein n=1 Tax=Saguinus oedipus TaxID=9490 RepID=A0ABQ9UEU8_SAGOE|nr:hypothetical protein P7K49_026696 [Saguinus oedipus]
MLDHLPFQALRAPQSPRAFPTESRGDAATALPKAGERRKPPAVTQTENNQSPRPPRRLTLPEDHPRLANSQRRRKRAFATRVRRAPPRRLPAALGPRRPSHLSDSQPRLQSEPRRGEAGARGT